MGFPVEIERAIEVAKKGNPRRAMVLGCALRRGDGVLVAFANNACQFLAPAQHAEARAAKKATPGSVAYVVRVRKLDGTLSMAKPCPSCQNRLRAHGVVRVVYSNWEGAFEELWLH